jgi:seryl-tRNA synthetase
VNESAISNRYSNEGVNIRPKRPITAAGANDDDGRAERLQRLVFELQSEKRELQEKTEKLEQGKQRMERILKQTMAKAAKDPNAELVEELSVLSKRIEYMEAQSDERSKS